MDSEIVWIILLLTLTTAVFTFGGFVDINSSKSSKTFDEDDVTNIAHRGARSLAPENTLMAARTAYESGADMWETDVQLTADRVPVLIHDDTLERTTDAESVYPQRDGYTVSDFTLGEIKRLDSGSWFVAEDPFEEIEKGNVPPADVDSFSGLEVPTLEEGLELTAQLGWEVNLELKPIKNIEGDREELSKILVNKVLALVEEEGLSEDVVVSSFDRSLVRLAKERNPEIRGALLVKSPDSGDVEWLETHRVDYYNVSGRSLLEDGEALKQLTKMKEAKPDLGINVWTVNEPGDLEYLAGNQYIGGVITDFPQRLARIIDK
ncbi:MAG: glycerophosphodiester phosphodiesterase [Candidatus Bipolaricaulota bacterium]